MYEEHWDILLILDSCRADLFERGNWLDDKFSTRQSPASHSQTSLQRTFGGRECHDTVYVTANPHTLVLSDGTFHAVDALLEESFDVGVDPPDVVAQHIAQAAETSPHKRIIGPFMQPHHPHIGKQGCSVDVVSWRKPLFPRRAIPDELKRAYIENLTLVLKEIQKLTDGIEGKVVLTVEYGELLGERQRPIRGYEHKMHFHHPALRTVPWFELPAESQRTVCSDPLELSVEYNESRVQVSLESLGYVA